VGGAEVGQVGGDLAAFELLALVDDSLRQRAQVGDVGVDFALLERGRRFWR